MPIVAAPLGRNGINPRLKLAPQEHLKAVDDQELPKNSAQFLKLVNITASRELDFDGMTILAMYAKRSVQTALGDGLE